MAGEKSKRAIFFFGFSFLATMLFLNLPSSSVDGQRLPVVECLVFHASLTSISLSVAEVLGITPIGVFVSGKYRHAWLCVCVCVHICEHAPPFLPERDHRFPTLFQVKFCQRSSPLTL